MAKTTYSDESFDEIERFEPRSKKHKSKRNKKRNRRSEILSTFIYILVALGIVLLVHQFLFAPVSVDGESMMPTLRNRDRIILNKIEKIDRFDIVVFPGPDDPSRLYIKRIIGMPGDEILMQEDTLYINGKAVNEPYLDVYKSKLEKDQLLTGDFTLMGKTGVSKVPEGEYFVMGDNRSNSKDSRIFGFVHADKIDGTAELRIWPLNDFGFIKDRKN
ncbi:signal peptidase I [Carnobacterium gallinarum]|uniref:signal peptidase I n=1 Tax=Carnobacterium gallinarum TaxID=2749 RepID=UPI00054DE00D|nr:signal peptidase I [Carnobacterium gallinarum]